MAASTQNNMAKTWAVTIVLIVIGALIFLRPFLSVIALAALTAYLFNPIYQRSLKWFKGRQGPAAALTTFVSILVFGIPLLVIFAITAEQALKLVKSIDVDSLSLSGDSLNQAITNVVNNINQTIESASGVANAVKPDSIISFVRDSIPGLLNSVAGIITDFVSSIPHFFAVFIIYLFVFIGFLVHQAAVIKNIKALSPFDKTTNELYFKRIGAMTKAMVKGQLLIAFLQGTASALSLLVLGWGEYILFFIVLFTFMNLIPLGSGIVTIPLGILTILFGQWWQGAVILLNHFLVVTNIDNIRPKLVPKEARLPAALTILAAFAGVVYFGLLGVIYGPIIMIFFTTTIEAYIEQKRAIAPAK